ncbi:hypothetical protein GCM10029964_124260 [Kibdelosporangium lantanae]
MAWQDDLRELDEALSAGRIKAEEYRRRRDDLLAAASSNPVVTRRIQRHRPTSIANAFTGGEPKEGDLQTDGAAEVTQQVAVNEKKTDWEAAPPKVVDSTSYATNTPPPVMQGSELFGLTSTSGTATTSRPRWPRFVIAVVVLVLVAGVTWWFAFRDPGTKPAPTNTQPAAAGQADQFTLDRLPSPLPDVPLSTSGVVTVDQAQIYSLIQPDEAGYLAAGGTEKIFYRWAGTNALSYAVYVAQAKDPAGATALSGKAVARAKGIGLTPATVPDLPKGVTVNEVFGPASAIAEVTYTSGRMAVLIRILQTGPNNERELQHAVQQSAGVIVKALPAA